MCKEMLQSTSELGEDAMINRMCSGNGTTVVCKDQQQFLTNNFHNRKEILKEDICP